MSYTRKKGSHIIRCGGHSLDDGIGGEPHPQWCREKVWCIVPAYANTCTEHDPHFTTRQKARAVKALAYVTGDKVPGILIVALRDS